MQAMYVITECQWALYWRIKDLIFFCFSTNGTVINMSKLVKKQTHVLQNGDVIYFVYRKSEPEQSELLMVFNKYLYKKANISTVLWFFPSRHCLCVPLHHYWAASLPRSLWWADGGFSVFHVVFASPHSSCGVCVNRRHAKVRPQSGFCLAFRDASLCGACDAHKGTVWSQPGGPSALHLKFPLLHRKPLCPRPSRSR